MTLKDAEKKYGIPYGTLEKFVSNGLIRKSENSSDFCEDDFDRLGIINILLEAEFSVQEVKVFLTSVEENKTEQKQITMLTNKRRLLLDEIHKKQKLLDRLDYMLWEKKRKMTEKKEVFE